MQISLPNKLIHKLYFGMLPDNFVKFLLSGVHPRMQHVVIIGIDNSSSPFQPNREKDLRKILFPKHVVTPLIFGTLH